VKKGKDEQDDKKKKKRQSAGRGLIKRGHIFTTDFEKNNWGGKGGPEEKGGGIERPGKNLKKNGPYGQIKPTRKPQTGKRKKTGGLQPTLECFRAPHHQTLN